jgi:lipopolysaccharide transport system ATP-binding protein
MEPIIKVENLGKSYIIGHQHERYVALRDVLTNKAKLAFSKTKNILSGGQLIAGNELEEFWALKDINFEVQQGDRVGIIGRNGAGKSTLLKVLSRITEPTTGSIRLKGRVASLLEVGTGFHPELSGRENIYLNGAILGMSRAEVKKKFDEIIDFAGVEKFLDTPVKRYSSGMYVRLAFAVAAHLEPEILIVDEVLAVGDAEFQKKCLGKMEDVSKNHGRTVLFVSHNMGAIKSLCEKAVVLSRGTIAYNGIADQAVGYYLDHSQKTRREISKSTLPSFLTAVKVFSKSQNDFFSIEEEINCLVEYTNNLEGRRLSVSIALFDFEGNYILNSPSITDTYLSGKAHPVGTFQAKATLPPNILNVGKYYVSVLLVENYQNPIQEITEILSFETISTAKSEIHSSFTYWPGLVRPNMEWIIKKL